MVYNKNKLCKTLHYCSVDMLNFHFSEKDMGLVSSSSFLCDFSREMFPLLRSIKWPNFIVWLPYFQKSWAIFLLHFFVKQAAENLKNSAFLNLFSKFLKIRGTSQVFRSWKPSSVNWQPFDFLKNWNKIQFLPVTVSTSMKKIYF